MSLMEDLEGKARGSGARIVYPEPQDPRIVEAAAAVAARQIATPVLAGPADALPPKLPDGVESEVIEDSARMAELAARYAEDRGVKEKIARRLVGRGLVYGAMMVRCGYADGMVAGIANATASVLQAAGLAIGYAEGVAAPSSCFIMVLPELRGERDVPVIFADCAVAIEPDAEELAGIALASARSARQFLGITPRVAMLSFSTAGSAAHAAVDKVKQATELAAAQMQDGFVEGELQFDAAIDPGVAEKKKVGGGEVAGQANVLIFPDLNSGNIAYKAVNRLAGAAAIGPVLQGFAQPVNDLSRGASVEDVVGTTVITVLQAKG
jgi:phosphate acetyltransferase